MNMFDDFDVWLLNNGFNTSIVALAIGLLLGGAIIPEVWLFIREKLLNKSARDFLAEFHALECQDARSEFRRLIFDAYFHAAPGKLAKELADDVEALEYPPDFPPDSNTRLIDYAGRFDSDMGNLPESRHYYLWGVVRQIMENKGKVGAAPPLTDDEINGLWRASRISAKFWDDCGRAILAGILKADSISDQIKSNTFDIKVLALAEIAKAKRYPVDQSAGKRGLFMLARHLDSLKPDQSRWRRLLNKLVGNPDGARQVSQS